MTHAMARDDEWKTLLHIFAGESLEMLEEVEPKLIELEKEVPTGNADSQVIHFIFRLFHSLKGGAAALDLQVLRGLTHRAETLLDKVRNDIRFLKAEHIDLMCQTCDMVRAIIHDVTISLDDRKYEPQIQYLVSRLADEAGERANLSETVPPSPLADVPENVAEYPPAAGGDDTLQDLASSLDELKIEITPEMLDRFTDEALELFQEAEEALLAFEKTPSDEEKVTIAFRCMHSFKGNSGFFGFSNLEKVSHAAENILDRIRQKEISGDKAVISSIFSALDSLRQGMAKLRSGSKDVVEDMDGLLAHLKKVAQGGPKVPPKIGEVLLAQGIITRDDLDEALEIQKVTVETGEMPAQQMKPPPGHSPKSFTPMTLEGKADESGPPAPVDPAISGGQEASQIQRQAIRVDTEKLDRLVDLVGELVISQSNIANSSELKGLKLERVFKEMDRLNKITKDLQHVTMAVRMVPVSGLFRKMVRPVRDLAKTLGKLIQLNIRGEETEVDKSVSEQLSDPMMHLIRNSCDHGIEAPDIRQKVGKSPTGVVTLDACHSGGEVVITISDDGKGLDRARILEKAIRQGLTPPGGENLRDEEVYKFIFEPGFSTADKVTELSGRGVGMDVVKKNVEKLKGRIDISSTQGQGLRFTIRIPLTLAIIDGMVVLVGKERYIIPTQSIIEFYRPTPNSITSITGVGEAVLIRGNLLTLHRIGKLFQLPGAETDPLKAQIIVVDIRKRYVGFMVDSILGQQQTVIKSLGSAFELHAGISGAAVMPDGKVGLILDPESLLRVAEGN